MFCNIDCAVYDVLIVTCVCAKYLQLVSAIFDPSTSVNIQSESVSMANSLCNVILCFWWVENIPVHNFIRFMSMHSRFHTSRLSEALTLFVSASSLRNS